MNLLRIPLCLVLSLLVAWYAAGTTAAPARATVPASAQPFDVRPLGDGAVEVVGARDALYSPSGEFLAIQGAGAFAVVPAADLLRTPPARRSLPARSGQIIVFLPSGDLIYSEKMATYAVSPAAGEPRKLFDESLDCHLSDSDLTDKKIVVVSDGLLITGEGGSDWDGTRGRILRYDLAKRERTTGASTSTFWYAALSPSRRYILFEHGSDENNDVDLYDVAGDKVIPIASHFRFSKLFPRHPFRNESPVAWLDGGDRFLAEITLDDDDEESEDGDSWLALFDIPSRRIVWRTAVSDFISAYSFQQLDEKRGLVGFMNDGQVYELSLDDGRLEPAGELWTNAFAASPDRRSVAYLLPDGAYLTTLGGSDRKLVDLSESTYQTAYKGMGVRAPRWSPRGDAFVVFDTVRAVIVRRIARQAVVRSVTPVGPVHRGGLDERMKARSFAPTST